VPLGSRTLTRSASRAVLLGVLASVRLVIPLHAQTTEQRRQLDAFRDSLEAVTDSTALHGQEARLLLVARQAKSDPLVHMRLGHLALRGGDLGGASHYDDAASEFKWATELAPKWPYAFYGLGLAEYALGERVAGTQERRPALARETWSRATQAFARAASLEPAFAVRLEELARRAIRERAPEKAEVVREALRRAALDLRGPRAARLVLALSRVQRETGDSGALSSFEAYLATGDDPAVAALELGRTRLLRGDLSGATLYLDGAAEDDPVAVAEYRADLSPIASEAELADFDLRRGPAREEMLRRFWSMRDRLELRADGERLAEHLRRMAFARREFLLVAADGTERLDDRGRIYVRHGEPDDRASFSIPGVEPNESWRYRRGGADLVLHFVAKQSPNDFRLVESVLDVSDGRAVLGASTGSSAGSAGGASAEQLLRSRSALSSLYQQAPLGRPDQTADYLARERALGRLSIQVGTLSDSYTLRFARDLDAWGALVVAGGSGAQPAIQVLFAIPGYAVEPATGVAGVVYPVRVRLVALDPSGTVVASIDTVTRLEPGDRIAANRSLMGRVSVPIRPGRIIAQAAVQYGDHGGTAFGIDTLAVPSPGSGEFALGDLLVGSRRGRLAVPLGDGSSIQLAPGGVAHRGDGVDLAVEIFGLEPGGAATLRLYVAPRDGPDAGTPDAPRWRVFPDAPAESRVTRGAGSGAIARWRIALPLKKLKPGSWTVAVVAADPAGRMARREARLEVQAP
jgi:GWxTD domain-containing protein